MNELEVLLESKKTPEEKEQVIVDKSNEKTKKFLNKHKKDLPEDVVKKIEQLAKTRMPLAWASCAISIIGLCVGYKGIDVVDRAASETRINTITSLGMNNPDGADILVNGDTKEGKRVLFYVNATIPAFILSLAASALSLFITNPERYKKQINEYKNNIKDAISVEKDPERKEKYKKMLKMVGTVDAGGQARRSKAEVQSLQKMIDKISGTVKSVITSKYGDIKGNAGFEKSSISIKELSAKSTHKNLKDISTSEIPVAEIKLSGLEKPANDAKFAKFANNEIVPELNKKMPKGVTIKKFTHMAGIQVIASFDLMTVMESVDFYRAYYNTILE